MRAFLAAMTMLCAVPVAAQMPDPVAMKAEQREKIAALAWMDGTWRGEATIWTRSGTIKVTQTERIGPSLDGTVKVIEGRGYNPDGATAFNALAIVAWNPMTDAFEMHAFSDGRIGVFPLTVTSDGFIWEAPAGPGKVRYVATLKDGVWEESGKFEMPDQPPRPFIDMSLRRLGATEWPKENPVPAK